MSKYDNILDKIKKIHFIGIGGSGMCPMAEILMHEGFTITGSDTYKSDSLERILGYGIKVFDSHKKENITDQELVVYTAAVKQDNPEIVEAKRLGIPVIERCEMLGILSRRYKKSVAVAGTHGKTSTTAMLTQIMMQGNADPTAIIGGKLPVLGGNSRIGKSDVMVCEACEYVDSFLQLNPYIALVLNIDEDHLDYFKNLGNIKKSFVKFMNKSTKAVIANGDDQNTIDCLKEIKDKEIITFGLSERNNYTATNIEKNKNGFGMSFDFNRNGKKLCEISLSIPGKHNVMNALASIACADYMGIKIEDIKKGIESFKGVHRRFEVLYNNEGIMVADDFAHHPTELTAVLNSAMSMGFERVIAVFQPHTFSRTYMLKDEFIKALSIPDLTIVSDILPVRETNTYNVYATDITDGLSNGRHIPTFEEITEYVAKNAQKGDLIITLGGGNVYVCANMICREIAQR